MKQEPFKILIVDDIPQNIQVLGTLLRDEGYLISFATEGNQAIEMASMSQFDLILLDIMMPEIDGFEVIKRLKQNLKMKDVPVIFITAKANIESLIKGFEMGAVDYITKPFNSKELIARVKTHLELKDIRKKLEEANAAKTKFLSIIAHDLKNPLYSMMGFSDFLSKRYNDFNEEDKIKFLNNINISSHQLYKLLENLLDWASVQTGRMDYNPQISDLSVMVSMIIKLHKQQADEKKISLISKIAADTIILADTNMINTVIRNLLSNAIKFTPSGGQVTVSSDDLQTHVKISVIDTGIGIKKENIENLFKIEVKCMTLGTNKEKGTGLGLVLCKEFIEKNNGKIWVESEQNKGSKFMFTLPKPSLS
ncbi:MAG: hybrid sensor histidine kinase/response regulator [Desulfobacterales bacterium]|nr:hybrid sensor histidine kinase/response regulator [Desulfobacterales bacterium]